MMLFQMAMTGFEPTQLKLSNGTKRRRQARPPKQKHYDDSYQFTIEELLTLLERHQDAPVSVPLMTVLKAPVPGGQGVLNKRDKKFLSFCIDSHNKIVDKGFSVTWMRTPMKERAEGARLLRELGKETDRFPRQMLSQDEFHFLELALSEHADFATEGMAEPFYASPTTDGIQVYRIARKLQNYLRKDVDPKLARPFLLDPDDVGGNAGMEYLAALTS